MNKRQNDDDNKSECSVCVSDTKMYNEELKDLFCEIFCKSLTIQEDNKQGTISVKGLTEVKVNSFEQLMQVFKSGEKNK